RLVRAAAERGIREIRALALPDNAQIRSLLEHYADDVEVLEEHGMLLMTVHVPPADEEDALDAMLSMLRYAALGTFIIPIWLGRRTLQQLLAQMEQKDPGEEE
ncbi:MAG: hypothetical protein R3200_15165, partial [Xanthomonadales bacterium]|nr:hypothetical protein [Xanthomonadales bacterium]